MKTIKIQLVAFATLLLSCNQTKTVNYDVVSIGTNGSYSIEVPSSVYVYQKEDAVDFTSFIGDEDKTTIIIQRMTKPISYYDNSESYENKGWNSQLLESNDSTYFLRRSKGIITSYELMRSKCIDGQRFLIQLSSIHYGQSQALDVMQHMYESLKRTSQTSLTNVSDNNFVDLKLYTNGKFSIKYPANWKVIKNPDGMSEAYIGSETIRLGFTILHFPCENTLREVVDEITSNSKTAGMKVEDDQKVNICGLDAYKMTYSNNINGLKVTEIGYTFIMQGELYNVKFGTDPEQLQENATLISEIVKSINLKL